ncbi:YhzD family protein [Alkalihalobacillus sp. LMS39]|uniref:YhzD family protein n=1 Tax=Alkalihalobacillus sp. LMS39 TaxID=2924032 RepID=UPI001FB2AAEC|nr:YhzD family protein [Alkalihalobacillus sp. LMS39]UOE95476.1 hypothetical protein MM271_07655 [Alkalihalobacillus sp. LMS39]
MKQYFLTAYDPTGETLLEETFEAASDDEAKAKGEKRLEEENLSSHTHRLTCAGKLLLFHR